MRERYHKIHGICTTHRDNLLTMVPLIESREIESR